MAKLLEIEDLRIRFDTDRGQVRAVNGVSLSVGQKEVVGLVGESGSGKSVTGLSVLRLLPEPPAVIGSGRIVFDGTDILELDGDALRRIRGARIGMVFQDPLSALNPVLSVGVQMTEAALAHGVLSPDQARGRSVAALASVGLADPEEKMRSFPHELSGGMRQRVMLAMALVLEPDLLIADEPTTALDVTVQAQIVELLRGLIAERSMALLLISHDLGFVAQLADRVAVMYAGHIVEEAPVSDILSRPKHPYTRGLLNSIPSKGLVQRGLAGIPGSVPDPVRLPSGCPFHPRCGRALPHCMESFPPDVASQRGRFACYNPEPEG